MEKAFDNTFGELSGAQDHTIINKIFGYIAMTLSTLDAKKDENENTITNRLCKCLSSHKPGEYPFYFHHQNIENTREGTSTDFAVFSTVAYAQDYNIWSDDYPALVKFEAKRLSSKLPKKREKEYVCGEYKEGRCVRNSGGIERFKNGRHGRDVTYAGLIGYIQTDSPAYWFRKVNEWIQEQIESASDSKLVWKKEDLLVQDYVKETLSCYSSVSARVQGDHINFKHLWIDFTLKQTP
ncbi:MAG: hypothetical protein PWQ72_1834 [Pseudothermotoga sp.]|jgi:hypothetical protein|uniref:hypothetical protein n=1 Tax=Pseudothermotoga sp. TaxID=2033661 RepID=UPI000E8570A4|nr:hypothetical protein [Pseudothermotoga sp.]MDI3495707.1 hypothetical protein [Pseudothermotoga sp.]HBJ80627.1 hypothetical protein [Pseudothermotoga sp.]